MQSGSTTDVSEVIVGRATIELLTDDGRFQGLGSVTINGVVVRSAAVPLRPDISTPDGIRYDTFRLDNIVKDGDDIVLETSAFGTQGLYGEYRDEYDSQQAWPRVVTEPLVDRLDWRLHPEHLELDGVQYDGFSYALRFRSDSRAIHQITMITTWELGGAAEGNTVLSQGQVNPPVYRCEKDTGFTTTCWRQLGYVGDPNGVSFQFSARYSPMQCFDFQYGPAGSLIGYWPEFCDVHSVVQKNPGEDVVFSVDKCLLPLGSDVSFAPKSILFAAAPAEGAGEHLMRDRWLRALEEAQRVMRDAFGIRKPYLLPETGVLYRCGLDEQGKLLVYIAGEPHEPQDTLAGWAKYLPALAAAGVRRIFPEPMAESDITEIGYDYKIQTGVHGDLVMSSICNVWEYRMSDFWGGWDAWENFYQKGKAAGMEVGHWIGMHLSCNAPILAEHPEFVCRAVNTRPHSGGYIINLTSGLNWNTACDWLLESFAEWKRHGLDYIFFDSIGNLGFMGVDYQAQMQPNAAGIARFIGGLNKMGIEAITVEGVSPVGIGRFGMSDNMTENVAASHAVAGQNDWSWWVGHEDMLVGTTAIVRPHANRTEQELQAQIFRALANGSLLMFGDEGDADDWPKNLDQTADAYHTYNQVQALMQSRRLLADGRGVEWQGDSGRVLFAYTAFDYDLPSGAGVEIVKGQQAQRLDATGPLATEPYTIYRISE